MKNEELEIGKTSILHSSFLILHYNKDGFT